MTLCIYYIYELLQILHYYIQKYRDNLNFHDNMGFNFILPYNVTNYNKTMRLTRLPGPGGVKKYHYQLKGVNFCLELPKLSI